VKAQARARLVSALAALILSSTAAYATTVGLTPAEDPSLARSGRSTPMPFIVSGCMDRLFEAGLIASDASAAASSRAEWEASVGNLAELREGLVDFAIRLYVEWKESSFRKETLLPSRIGYRLVRVSDGKIVAAGSVDGPPDSEDAAFHPEKEAAKAGAASVASCVELLTTLAKGEPL
jgi:hypothetical protein